MRHSSWFVVATAVLAGCPDRPVSAVYPVQGKVETKDLPANPNRDVDILFLIDNSGSMAEEQSSLRANFGKFMDVLSTIEGGIPNVHIGVATSSLGQSANDGTGNGLFGNGCQGSGDDGVLRTAPTISGRYIIDEESGTTRKRNYTGTLSDAFSAIANVGTQGCGIEQHLGAVKRALTNPGNAGFLRDDAKLAVIVIADEDDCSLAHKALFEGTADGTEVNFRCTREGIACNGGAADLSVPGLYTDCEPKTSSPYLNDVDAYVSFLKSLKADPNHDVIVAGIVGDTEPFEIFKDDQLKSVLKPSCSHSGQYAFPAVRTADFLAQFPQNIRTTICNDDLSNAMVEIGAQLKRAFGDPCFEAEIADLEPATDGLQADCTVSDVQRLPDGTDKELAIIPACGTGQVPCWRIEQDAAKCYYTDNQLKLVIDRGGVIPPSDTHVKASCVTTDGAGGFQ